MAMFFHQVMDSAWEKFFVMMDGREVSRVESVGGGDQGWQRHFVFHFEDGSSVRVEREAMQDARWMQDVSDRGMWGHGAWQVADAQGQSHMMRVMSASDAWSFERDVRDQMWDWD